MGDGRDGGFHNRHVHSTGVCDWRLRLGFSFSLALLRLRTGEGFVDALSYSTACISDNIDKAMLGHYGMNAANGIYSMAYRAIDMATVPLMLFKVPRCRDSLAKVLKMRKAHLHTL